MTKGDVARARQVQQFEAEAEVLATYQLDLLAQLEHQLRSVHRTMRQIEKLRSVRQRVGPELSNGERGTALALLHDQVDAIEREIRTQRNTCADMHGTVDRMQERLRAFRQAAQPAAAVDTGTATDDLDDR